MLPVTLHAGEAGDSSYVEQAINLGARRIGHGVNMTHGLMELVSKKDIMVEVNLSSNLQTGTVKDLSLHPAKVFHDYSIPFVICTDNNLQSNTSHSKECNLAITHLGMHHTQLAVSYQRALNYKFFN